MFAAIGSYLKHIPQLVGVELLLADGEAFDASLVVVKRTGTKVHFVHGEYGLTTLEAIARYVPDGVPVVLTVGGKGVIHRLLPEERQGSDTDLLKQVLPNAKSDDFYFQKSTLGTRTVLSVVRRASMDAVIAQFGAQGMVLLGAGLGPFAADLFREYFPAADTDAFTFGRHRLMYQRGVFGGYELLPSEQVVSTKRMDIAGEQLNERLVPAFAAAFSAISDIPQAQLNVPKVRERADDHRQRWAFRRSGIVLMAFFLLLLLGNVGYFMYYSDKVAGFAGSDGLSIQKEIEILQQQSSEREALLAGLWPIEVPRWGMAYMADRIGGTLPEGILLDEMAVYPRDEALSRKQRRPVHTPSAIRIKGTCADMPQLNRWMKQLRELAFCRSVELDRYMFDERNGVGVFGLQLTLEP